MKNNEYQIFKKIHIVSLIYIGVISLLVFLISKFNLYFAYSFILGGLVSIILNITSEKISINTMDKNRNQASKMFAFIYVAKYIIYGLIMYLGHYSGFLQIYFLTFGFMTNKIIFSIMFVKNKFE